MLTVGQLTATWTQTDMKERKNKANKRQPFVAHCRNQWETREGKTPVEENPVNITSKAHYLLISQ